jgi:hypothetical protein
VPVPDGDADRWKSNGWDPERQAALLDAAAPFVQAVPWTRRQQEQAQREVAAEMNSASEEARQARAYAATRRSMGYEDVLNGAVEAEHGDVRAIAVYAAPDRFQREWRITRSFPFARRTSTITPGAAPSRGIRRWSGSSPRGYSFHTADADVMAVARTADLLLWDSDIAERRAELHEMITEFQTQGLRAGAIVREFETQIAGINDIVRRRRENHVAHLVLPALTTAQGAAAINMPLLGVAAGPTAVAGPRSSTASGDTNPGRRTQHPSPHSWRKRAPHGKPDQPRGGGTDTRRTRNCSGDRVCLFGRVSNLVNVQ